MPATLPRRAQSSRMFPYCSAFVPVSGGIPERPTRHGGILHLSECSAGNSPHFAPAPSTGDRTERTVHPGGTERTVPLGQMERNVPYRLPRPCLAPANIIRNGPSHLSVRCVHLQRNGTYRSPARPANQTERNGPFHSPAERNGTDRSPGGGLFVVTGGGGIGPPVKYTKFQN